MEMKNNFKYIPIFFVLVTDFLIAQSNADYSELLKGLSKNYVSNYHKSESLKDFLTCYNVDYKTFKKDKALYDYSVHKFYNSESQIIGFLLKYKNDDTHINHWITTENPCKSTIKLHNMLKNSQASIILLYNYLEFDGNNTISTNSEFLESKNNINLLINFSEKNIGLKVKTLRDKWKKIKQDQ